MGSAGKDAVEAAEIAAEDQMTEQKALQTAAKASVEKQKQAYKVFEFKNPYAGIQNPYAGLETSFENTFEDLTVNQQQAQFQAQQGAQQRSNIMETMRGAAGGSGIAGLAQAMAGQGQFATQQISASIGQQESANQMARATGAQAAQQMQVTREDLIARGAGAADLQQRQGEAMVQQAESGREATLLGMEYGELQAAQAGVQAAYGAQQSAAAMELERTSANKAMWGNIVGDVVGGVATVVGAKVSDRRLKKNINKIGESPSGLNIYSFEYKNSKYGEGLFQGVMSDEVPREAVGTRDGYDIVDYSMLDVEFKQI